MGLAAETAACFSLLILFVFNLFGGAIVALTWLVKPL